MRNIAKCHICGDVIESKTRHDWVSCSGGHIFIDGGQDYMRAGTLKEGVTLEDIIYLDDPEIVPLVGEDHKTES